MAHSPGVLLDALKGVVDADADADGNGNGNGELTLGEAFRHVRPQVGRLVTQLYRVERRRDAKHVDFMQTPVLQTPDALRATPFARVGRP